MSKGSEGYMFLGDPRGACKLRRVLQVSLTGPTRTRRLTGGSVDLAGP